MVDKENKIGIINDICSLQVLPTKSIFNKAVDLFFEKWQNTSQEVNHFLNYFRKQKIEKNN